MPDWERVQKAMVQCLLKDSDKELANLSLYCTIDAIHFREDWGIDYWRICFRIGIDNFHSLTNRTGELEEKINTVLGGTDDYCSSVVISMELPEAQEGWRDQLRAIASLPTLADLKEISSEFNSQYFASQIARMQNSIQEDPELAIGTAKEIVETCCKSILHEIEGKEPEDYDLSKLVKDTLMALNVHPESIPCFCWGEIA